MQPPEKYASKPWVSFGNSNSPPGAVNNLLPSEKRYSMISLLSACSNPTGTDGFLEFGKTSKIPWSSTFILLMPFYCQRSMYMFHHPWQTKRLRPKILILQCIHHDQH